MYSSTGGNSPKQPYKRMTMEFMVVMSSSENVLSLFLFTFAVSFKKKHAARFVLVLVNASEVQRFVEKPIMIKRNACVIEW